MHMLYEHTSSPPPVKMLLLTQKCLQCTSLLLSMSLDVMCCLMYNGHAHVAVCHYDTLAPCWNYIDLCRNVCTRHTCYLALFQRWEGSGLRADGAGRGVGVMGSFTPLQCGHLWDKRKCCFSDTCSCTCRRVVISGVVRKGAWNMITWVWNVLKG